jgi:tetratricopeptide (TPR) repeat protein
VTTARPPLRDSYEGLHDRAQAALRTGDVEGAVSLFRRLVEKLSRLSDRVLAHRPELRDLHRRARLELTGLLRIEGRYAEAIEAEEVLLRTHPEDADSWRTDLAVMRVAKGEVERGLSELQEIAEATPDEAWHWMILGREARIEGRFAESQAALDRALAVCGEDDPDLAELHYHRFLLLRAMGRLDDAVAAWEEALACDTDVSESIREVYQTLTEVGRYDEARRYVARDENELQAGYQRGLLATLTGSPAQARQEWQAVADLDPDEFEYGHDAWVESVLRLGDPIPALEWLQDNLSQFGTPRLLILSGIGWAMNQDAELAVVLFQEAINLLRRSRPPKQKLDSADWRLLDTLVTDDETKMKLKPYFAVVETLWG